MFEVEVHASLRAFLKEQEHFKWQHHLTMARLVARALRLGRSALIQTGTTVEQYALSYLTPALLGSEALLLVVPSFLAQWLLEVEIPQLQQALGTKKEIRYGDRWPKDTTFKGLMLTSPQSWLEDRLKNLGCFPANIPTLIEQADYLEQWTMEQLTLNIEDYEWDFWMDNYLDQREEIRDIRISLTKAFYGRPPNPYQCYLLTSIEQELLGNLYEKITTNPQFSKDLHPFWQQWQLANRFLWVSMNRETGKFTLHCSPVEVSTALSSIWQQQPVVIIGQFLDTENTASLYRNTIGLGDLTCLKFSLQRQQEQIQLYLPDRLPMPNTPQFQKVLIEQIQSLINLSSHVDKPIVLLIGDVPLKAQVGAKIAAEFGTKVQVEKTDLAANGILVSSWQFWRLHYQQIPTPQLLIITTLPLPSLENPEVAARVAYHKRQRQDWFRLYLLPTALQEIQHAVLPLRLSQGVVALLDNRVNYRSYGNQILNALEPYAKCNYIDTNWFAN